MADTCTHLDQIKDVAPSGNGCVECLRMGTRWVHLRRCTDVRPHRLLRQLARAARDRPLPRDRASDHPVVRTGRGLVLVLRRRDHVRSRRRRAEPVAHVVASPVPEPTDLPIKPFTSQKTFTTWLAKHHAKSNGIWIKIAKKDSGIRSVDARRSPRGRALLRLDRRATRPLRRRSTSSSASRRGARGVGGRRSTATRRPR